MAGKIVADTLEHSTAGSVTTDYVVNGSAKAWINFNGTGTIAARDSLNHSSLTDNATGDYTVTITNAMGNANYHISANAGPIGTTSATHIADFTVGAQSDTAPTSTAVRAEAFSIPHNTGADAKYAFMEFNGDLA